MKQSWIVLLIITVIGFGFAAYDVSAMTAEHPTAEVVEEEVAVTEMTPEEEGLESVMEEDVVVSEKKVKTSKPKDHPAH